MISCCLIITFQRSNHLSVPSQPMEPGSRNVDCLEVHIWLSNPTPGVHFIQQNQKLKEEAEEWDLNALSQHQPQERSTSFDHPCVPQDLPSHTHNTTFKTKPKPYLLQMVIKLIHDDSTKTPKAISVVKQLCLFFFFFSDSLY